MNSKHVAYFDTYWNGVDVHTRRQRRLQRCSGNAIQVSLSALHDNTLYPEFQGAPGEYAIVCLSCEPWTRVSRRTMWSHTLRSASEARVLAVRIAALVSELFGDAAYCSPHDLSHFPRCSEWATETPALSDAQLHAMLTLDVLASDIGILDLLKPGASDLAEEDLYRYVDERVLPRLPQRAALRAACEQASAELELLRKSEAALRDCLNNTYGVPLIECAHFLFPKSNDGDICSGVRAVDLLKS